MELYNYNQENFDNKFGNLKINNLSFTYPMSSQYYQEEEQPVKLSFSFPKFKTIEQTTQNVSDNISENVSLNSNILLGRNANVNGVNAKLLHFINTLYEEYDKYTAKPLAITSGMRSAKQKVGKYYATSKHNSGRAIDLIGNFNILRKALASPRIQELMQKYNISHLDETTPEAMAKTGATGKHFHIQIN